MGHVPRFPEFQECEDPEKELSNAVILSYSSVLDTLLRRARLPMTRSVETRYPPFVLRFFQFGDGKHVVFASLYGGGGLTNKRYHTFGLEVFLGINDLQWTLFFMLACVYESINGDSRGRRARNQSVVSTDTPSHQPPGCVYTGATRYPAVVLVASVSSTLFCVQCGRLVPPRHANARDEPIYRRSIALSRTDPPRACVVVHGRRRRPFGAVASS